LGWLCGRDGEDKNTEVSTEFVDENGRNSLGNLIRNGRAKLMCLRETVCTFGKWMTSFGYS